MTFKNQCSPGEVRELSNEEISSADHYRRQLETICNNATLAFFIIDERQQCVYMNPAAEKLTGYTLAEIQGRSLHHAVHHLRPDGMPYPPEECPIVQSLSQASQERGEEVFIHKNGAFYPVAFTTSPIREQGRAVGTVLEVQSIVERKRVEEVLRESGARFRFLAESMPQKIFTAKPNGDVDYFNRQWTEFTGLSFEQIRDWGWTQFIHPDDVEENVRVWQHSIDTGEEFQFEHRFRRADGEYCWHLSRARAMRDAEGKVLMWIGSNTDIDDVKRDEEALKERARLAALSAEVGLALTQSDTLPEMLQCCAEAMAQHLDAAFARIWTLNETEKVLELQSSAGMYTHLDGPHSRVPVGKFKIGLIAEECQPHLTNDVQHDPRVGDKEWATRERMIAFAGYPLIVEDRLIGVMAMFARHPLTETTLQAMESVANGIALGIERKRAEEESARLLGEAQEANRLKDEFLATVSHELRTPLTAVLGWAHMLRMGQLDDQSAARALETIERNARSQSQLIEDLLDVSRIITGKLRLDVRAIDPASFIEAAIEAVRPAAEAKRVRIQKVMDTGVTAVSGDPARLQQVVWNLLSNAIKFTPKEGRVQVRLERINSHIEIVVSDTGAGISTQFLPHVFDRFRQADGTTTRQHGGLGLGLAIVRHLVELHGGTVDAESLGEGQGAVFTVKLPLMVIRPRESESERVHPAARDAHPPLDCPEQIDGLKVLVVDDEADTREMLKVALEQCGAKVTIAASAEAALKLLEESQPDVLVSDIGMPETDGYELIRSVRQLPAARGGRIPAVALTAYARAEDRLRALRSGYQMHIPKPVDLPELVAIIASLFERLA